MYVRKTPIPVSHFAALVETALIAFGADDRYAVAMARRAVHIQRDRKHRAEVAQRRREARQGC